MYINLLICLCVLVYLSVEVDSQVCIRQTYVTKMVPRTYRNGHHVTYSERCKIGFYDGWCIHSRWKTDVIEKYEEETIVKSIKYCCDGYKRENDTSADSSHGLQYRELNSTEITESIPDITCKPICEPACENGYCKYPGNCECNAGYTIDEENNYTCTPFCEKGCGNGTCIAPNTCRCEPGYELLNGTCQPVCTKPCYNGTCVSPDTCECFPGFRKTIRDTCEAHCSQGCISGHCISPEKCYCYSGYILEENTHPNRCVIQCSLIDNMCGNGTCEASDRCHCFPGYHIRKRNLRDVPLCVPMPMCTDCKGGDCVSSPKCVEKEGSITLIGDTTRTTSITSTTSNSASLPSKKTDTYKIYENRNGTMNNSKDVTNGESIQMSWMQQHTMSILIPIMVVVTAGIIMLLVWRRTRILNVFPRRSYVIHGDDPKHDESQLFKNIQFFSNNNQDSAEVTHRI